MTRANYIFVSFRTYIENSIISNLKCSLKSETLKFIKFSIDLRIK